MEKTFEAVGRHAVSITQIVVSTGEVHHVDSSVMVKVWYVRIQCSLQLSVHLGWLLVGCSGEEIYNRYHSGQAVISNMNVEPDCIKCELCRYVCCASFSAVGGSKKIVNRSNHMGKYNSHSVLLTCVSTVLLYPSPSSWYCREFAVRAAGATAADRE